MNQLGMSGHLDDLFPNKAPSLSFKVYMLDKDLLRKHPTQYELSVGMEYFQWSTER